MVRSGKGLLLGRLHSLDPEPGGFPLDTIFTCFIVGLFALVGSLFFIGYMVHLNYHTRRMLKKHPLEFFEKQIREMRTLTPEQAKFRQIQFHHELKMRRQQDKNAMRSAMIGLAFLIMPLLLWAPQDSSNDSVFMMTYGIAALVGGLTGGVATMLRERAIDRAES